MKQHNSTYFRRNMSRILSHCEELKEPVLITTNVGEDCQQKVVLITEEQYTMMINQINNTKQSKMVINKINGTKQ